MKKKDIFDKIMDLSVFKKINPFYKKHKEKLLYLFFGGCTSIISFIVFAIGCYVFKWNEIFSNNVSWIIAVLFAYITNRTWVFETKSRTFNGTIKEIFSFFAGRFLTLWVENGIIYLFITVLNFNKMAIKIIAQIIIIILNYIISKFFIFKTFE